MSIKNKKPDYKKIRLFENEIFPVWVPTE